MHGENVGRDGRLGLRSIALKPSIVGNDGLYKQQFSASSWKEACSSSDIIEIVLPLDSCIDFFVGSDIFLCGR